MPLGINHSHSTRAAKNYIDIPKKESAYYGIII